MADKFPFPANATLYNLVYVLQQQKFLIIQRLNAGVLKMTTIPLMNT